MSGEQSCRAFVVDNGSSSCRAGFAGDDAPLSVFPSAVASPGSTGVVVGMGHPHSYVGDEAIAMKGQLPIKYPVEEGMITNWDDIEKIWHHAIYQKLGSDDPPESNVLLTEVPCNPVSSREKMTQVMFESYETPGLYLANQAVLSLLASGRRTGVVLDSGDCVTYAVPVYDGFALPHATRRVILAGRDVTDRLMESLVQRGIPLKTADDRCAVQGMKEKLSFVAVDDRDADGSGGVMPPETSYELPDGQVVTVGHELWQCAEVLFRPGLADMQVSALQDLVHDSLSMAVEHKLDMLGAVVLSGGAMLCPGMDGRLQAELKHPGANVVRAQRHSAWVGGSMLASLPAFAEMCVTKDEYDEFGPAIVHRKCF